MYQKLDESSKEARELTYKVYHHVFSPDSKHLAFAVRHGNQWHVKVDGVEEKPAFTAIEQIIFSPDLGVQALMIDDVVAMHAAGSCLEKRRRIKM